MQKTFHKDDIETIASEIIGRLSSHDAAAIIALSGDLGAGKTTLTQAIARQLGISENVISPTFVIQKRYPLSAAQKFDNLIHIDAYRLKNSAELEKLGWVDIASDAKNLILIEWPERVPELIPEHAIRIELSHTTEHEREIIVHD